MRNSAVGAALVVAVLCAPVLARAADDATLLRLFLKDGTSLVCYGEPARVGDRVVFSLPAAATPDPPLQLVNISADRVDWDRTNRYAASARATHYIQNQADTDYALLSNAIAQALNDVTLTPDPAKRLAIAERARQRLSAWPAEHFNYRVTEIRQMLVMLDDAIADLRASTAPPGRFDLSFSAFTDPPAIVEPLLPPPTPQEAIANVLNAARLVDNASERSALLATALTAFDRDGSALPDAWAAETRADVEGLLLTEQRVDRAYRVFTTRIIALANRRARLADVRGLERLQRYAEQRDRVLGGKRPESVTALIAVLQEKLDGARRLQLARERWMLRASELRRYNLAIRQPIDLLGQLNVPLEAIKSLAGSSPLALTAIERTCERIVKLASAVVPPDEVAAAHALLMSAVQLARQAAQIRREAALAGDMTRAWDASSAAAGALMLGARARADIVAQVRPPQLQ